MGINLIKKGTNVYIYNIKCSNNQQIPGFDIIIGEDVLKSNEDYDVYNDDMVILEDYVSDAIFDYMSSNYPHNISYEFEIGED